MSPSDLTARPDRLMVLVLVQVLLVVLVLVVLVLVVLVAGGSSTSRSNQKVTPCLSLTACPDQFIIICALSALPYQLL